MRVRNKTDHGVFVQNYGVVPGRDEATVPKSDAVKQLIKDNVLAEVRTQQSDTNDNKEGEGS